MADAFKRTWIFWAAVMWLATTAVPAGADAPATQPNSSAPSASSGSFASRLRGECDALIDAAVQRGYGWAWGEFHGGHAAGTSGGGGGAAAAAAGGSAGGAPVPVRFEPLTTPAAGLVLLWSSDLLNEPRYKQAAQQAARGIAAAVEGNGRVPGRVNFGRAPIGIDALAAVPDRAPTIASLALLLTLHGRGDIPDERAQRAIAQTATWLLRQQTRAGAWPAQYPPDARPNDAMRLIRLDQSGYRDATLAMLLAGDVLESSSSMYDRARVRAIDQLLRLRVEQRGTIGRGLWRGMYELDGSMPDSDEVPEADRDVDVLASGFAVQTLLAAYVVTGERDMGLAADEAVKVFETLRQPDGTWKRTYGLPHATSRPTSEPAFEQVWSNGWFGLDEVIKTTRDLKLLGREKFLKLQEAGFPARQQIAQILCGLADGPLSIDFPISREEIAPYVVRHEAMWRLLDGDPPGDLPGRVRRLWVLYLRTRLEQMQEKSS